MKTLEESIAFAMDSTDSAIVTYLPYILQDFWEMGADPADMIRLMEKYTAADASVHVLDLGCGKGPVSVRIAQRFGCECWGVDGIPEFIDEARQKASELGVERLCHFETEDIREWGRNPRNFDVIILGAVGPVWGSYYETLRRLKRMLHPQGIFLIDEAYICDESSFHHPVILKKKELFHQIQRAGMAVVEELLPLKNGSQEADDSNDCNLLLIRCNELIAKYPEKKALFEAYIRQQEQEYAVLKREDVVALTLAIKESHSSD